MGNHVYYARYLHFLEAARGEFFRHLGTTFEQWQDRQTLFPVIECAIRYRAPARYDDLLSIEVHPSLAQRVRLNFAYQVKNQKGTPILEAETFHVCTGIDEKPRRLPPELETRLAAWLPETRNSQ
jgi:acyl-CoA thioester hydrolase